MSRFSKLIWVSAVLMFATAGRGEAGVIITLADTGSDVTATASGSINTTALSDSLGGYLLSGNGGLGDFGGAINSSRGFGTIGGVVFILFSGPTFAGPAYPFLEINKVFSSSSGDALGLGFTANFGGRVGVLLPSAYVSGTSISSTGTWTNTEFGELGVSDGDSFTWRWGSGATEDYLTINVGDVAAPAPAPAPATLALLGIGLAGLGFSQRRKA